MVFRRTAIVALILQAILRADPQVRPPDAAPEPIVLKSTAHAVQLDVFVDDASGHPVHGLQKSDFVVSDNGHPRDIRIFAGEIDRNLTAPSSPTVVPPGIYSNRFGMGGSRVVTAIVIDAIPRPDGLQKNPGVFALARPDFWFNFTRARTRVAIRRMAPGQLIAIYAACPELRIVQDFTFDPERLLASLEAFVPPPLSRAVGKKQWPTIDTFVPPMLAALRDVAGQMSGASGHKSVVWISQAYGTELNLSAISDATDLTIARFSDLNVPLYAVDSRFSPGCPPPRDLPVAFPGQADQGYTVRSLTCSQPEDVSDGWMQYLAKATGGRAFSGGKVYAVEGENVQTREGWGRYDMSSVNSMISEALSFAVDGSRYAYEMGFYVPESELDGKIHKLTVTVPGKPKFELRYRTGYTASASATSPPAVPEKIASDSNSEAASPLGPDEVGIDAKIDLATKNELQVFIALAPDTVSRTADHAIVCDATFTQTDGSGKQLAKVQETVRVPSPETPTDMVRFTRTMKLINGAIVLHVRIRDQATNRVGSIAIPIGKP
jgi:VWFA-related protein